MEDFELTGGDEVVGRVRFVNSEGDSEWSDASNNIEIPRAEEIASDLVVDEVSADGFRINFNPNDGIDTYQIRVCKASDPEDCKVITVTADGEPVGRRLSSRRLAAAYTCPVGAEESVSEEVGGLEPGTEYTIQIVVAGQASERQSFSTATSTAPSAPTGVRVV